jgi:GntR family transcriptional regulator / MocR family aminotransferase
MTIDPEVLALWRLDSQGQPLQEQLYARVRRAIVEGQLSPGQRLPSSRALASQLGVARGTVDAAYARLAGEGYVLARGPAGTVVSPNLRTDTQSLLPKPAVGRTCAKAAPAVQPRPFQLGLPALDMFPRGLWARLTARGARGLAGGSLAYPEPVGFHRLRTALVAYLAVSRGVVCEPGQVIITAGFQSTISLVARTLLQPRDKVWFEEPGYFLARDALQMATAQLVPIPIDDEGIRIDVAEAYAPDARLAVVTPSHQSPLGVALSLARRQALLAWANAVGAWVVEDDYDSEFHYVGRKLPALKSLDAADRVIYAGSFSKTLFPSLRLGYMVVPAALVGRLADAANTAYHGAQILGQMVVAEFMSEGHFARHLKRMCALYAARRAAFARALVAEFGEEIELSLQAGGMSLLLRFRDPVADVDLVRRALRHGLAPTALSDQYIGDVRENGLLLGFTNIPETEAVRYAVNLRRALKCPNGGD